MARPGIVGMNVSPAAREAVRQLSFALTGKVGDRVTLDGAILAACEVATTHIDQAAEAARRSVQAAS